MKHPLCSISFDVYLIKIMMMNIMKWRPSSLSELTPMILYMGLTHLGSEAFI